MNFYAQIWVVGFCVLYYQTIIFTGVYQRWTTYALKPKSVLGMHFRANSKKTPSLGKNDCRLRCLDKSLSLGKISLGSPLNFDFFSASSTFYQLLLMIGAPGPS